MEQVKQSEQQLYVGKEIKTYDDLIKNTTPEKIGQKNAEKQQVFVDLMSKLENSIQPIKHLFKNSYDLSLMIQNLHSDSTDYKKPTKEQLDDTKQIVGIMLNILNDDKITKDFNVSEIFDLDTIKQFGALIDFQCNIYSLMFEKIMVAALEQAGMSEHDEIKKSIKNIISTGNIPNVIKKNMNEQELKYVESFNALLKSAENNINDPNVHSMRKFISAAIIGTLNKSNKEREYFGTINYAKAAQVYAQAFKAIMAPKSTNTAIEVKQRECFVIDNYQQLGAQAIGTNDIRDCIFCLIYNKKTKKCLVAHIDSTVKKVFIKNALNSTFGNDEYKEYSLIIVEGSLGGDESSKKNCNTLLSAIDNFSTENKAQIKIGQFVSCPNVLTSSVVLHIEHDGKITPKWESIEKGVKLQEKYSDKFREVIIRLYDDVAGIFFLKDGNAELHYYQMMKDNELHMCDDTLLKKDVNLKVIRDLASGKYKLVHREFYNVQFYEYINPAILYCDEILRNDTLYVSEYIDARCQYNNKRYGAHQITRTNEEIKNFSSNAYEKIKNEPHPRKTLNKMIKIFFGFNTLSKKQNNEEEIKVEKSEMTTLISQNETAPIYARKKEI